MAEIDYQGFVDSVARLKDGSRGDKATKAIMAQAVATVERYAFKNGLEPSDIVSLLDIALRGQLDDILSKKIVKSLYPRTTVPDSAIIDVLGIVGTKKSLPLKLSLLKWIILVFDFLESKKTLSACYGVLFHFLGYDLLRPTICHLLYLVTRRDHVKPFRCRKLLELSRHFGAEPALLGLISAYKAYAPELITLSIPPTRASLFKHPDQIWERNLNRIQSRQPLKIVPQVTSKQPRGRRPQQAAKAPSLLTNLTSKEHLSVQDITSLEDLAQNVDKLEFPNQLAAVLSNRMLQHLLSCQAERSTVMRLSHWLSQTLLELCFRTDQTAENKRVISELLDQAVGFSKFMQEELPTIETFLSTFLRTWNGVDHADQIFSLLSMMNPLPFDTFCTFYLKPLQRLFFSSPVSWKAKLLSTFAALLQNWASIDWKLFYESVQGSSDRALKEMVFGRLTPETDHFRTMHDFILLVDSMCVVAFQDEDDHILLQHAALSFFDIVVELHTLYNMPFVIIPSAALVYHCLLSDTGMATSRICGIITKYKEALHSLKKATNSSALVTFPGYTSKSFSNGLGSIELYNKYIMDICSLVWKTRPINEKNEYTSSFPLPPALLEHFKLDPNFPLAFAFTHSAAFGSFARVFQKSLYELQGSNEEVTVESLRPGNISNQLLDFRITYLDYLKIQGFHGLNNFLYTFINSLRKTNPDV